VFNIVVNDITALSWCKVELILRIPDKRALARTNRKLNYEELHTLHYLLKIIMINNSKG
jgi:hypothetical protein